jgi:hypothetical protein
MNYIWMCKHCENEVVVQRPVKEIDVGPDDNCECGEHDFTRVIRSANFILGREGTIPWHSEAYSSTRRTMDTDKKYVSDFIPGETFSSQEDRIKTLKERKEKRKREHGF